MNNLLKVVIGAIAAALGAAAISEATKTKPNKTASSISGGTDGSIGSHDTGGKKK